MSDRKTAEQHDRDESDRPDRDEQPSIDVEGDDSFGAGVVGKKEVLERRVENGDRSYGGQNPEKDPIAVPRAILEA